MKAPYRSRLPPSGGGKKQVDENGGEWQYGIC